MRCFVLFLAICAVALIAAVPAEAGHCPQRVAFVPTNAVLLAAPAPAFNQGFSFQSNRRGTQIQSFGGGFGALGVGGSGFSFQERRGPLGRVRSTQIQGR